MPSSGTIGLSSQKNKSSPASTYGADVIVIIIESVIGQAFVEVNLRVTVPAEVSSTLGS